MGSTTVRVGATAPDFTLPDADGSEKSLHEHLGSWVVLYFYPKDNSPGCTKQACAFRDAYQDFTDAGAVVIGVSSDTSRSHAGFAERNRLPFLLLADRHDKVRDSYGVHKTGGILPGRVTYIIDPNGVVKGVYASQLRPTSHVEKSLEVIAAGPPAQPKNR